MAKLIRLEEDGPLGPAGAQVWVNDDAEPEHKPAPRKAAPKKSAK
ncbi:MAG TPA: hypothetical protein VFV01_16840 [Spirillospora sp.]|nr:hypothetical protein [Spirillospora sp.]